MQSGNNIVEYGKNVDKALASFQKQCPKDIKVAKISELPKYVDDSVTNFMKEFGTAIIAVILVTMLLLPFRVASVAGITVPISVFITLAFLYFFGIELHTVSLASLILVLGMIVDNSIVVIDNHVEKMDHGMSRWHASIQSAKELFTPILTATLAIFIAYLPLGFMVPGTAGEFLETIPIVVGIALTVSVAVSTLLVPYMNYVLIKKGLKSKNNKKKRRSFLDILQSWFDKSLDKAFNHPKIVILIGIATIALAVIIFKGLNQQLFPEMERNQFAVEVYLPTGASLESTAKVVDSLETVLLKDKRVTNVTSFIGTSSPRFHTVYAPNMPASNYGQLLINTVSNDATREVVNEYSPKYSDNFANAHVKWKILALQGFKAPIEVRISSDSIKDIRKAEEQLKDILKKTKHLVWVRDDWDQKQQNIKVNIDRDKANRMGYSKGFVATSLMVGLDGLPLTTIWENDYPVEVRLTQESDGKKNINTLGDQYITSLSNFSATPLRSFADFTPEWTEGTIVRRNGVPTLTIFMDNDAKKASSAIFDEIKPQIDALSLPAGTSINYGGEFEMQNEVFTPMTIALAISILLIFFILLFQFKKEKLSLLIMSTMLLTLPGAAIGLVLMRYPFSVTAFVGITSLCGMVVRNGIILIDYARNLRENTKMSVHAAALAAGKRRMRPIFLTSAAAAVGVIPMIMSRSPLWGPLGSVICFGLLTSMVLTLYILPILYSLVYTDKPKKKKGFWSVPVNKVLTIAVIILLSFSAQTHAQTLSLDSCKKLALINNYSIKEAANETAQSLQQKKEAFTHYFPQASASIVAMRSSDYMIKGSIPQMNLPVYDGNPANLLHPTQFTFVPQIPITALDYLNTAALTVTQPLFTGGRIINGNKLAKTAYKINKEKQVLTATEVSTRTEELYWTVISLSEKINTINSYRKLLDTLQHNVSVAHKAGLVQHTDLLKVQLKLNEIEMNSMKLNDGLKLSKRALCQHIGIPCDSSLVLTDTPVNLEIPQSFYTKPATAVTNRPEYKMLNNAVIVGELQKKISVGESLPQLAVGVAGYYVDIMNTNSKNTFAFASLSIPITDWWAAAHKIKQSDAKLDNAKNKLNETSELLTLQIEQANNELNECYFQINIAQRSLENAKENLKITNDNYKAGVSTMSDLLEAQSVYQAALDSLNEAKCNYQIKKAKYLQATANYK